MMLDDLMAEEQEEEREQRSGIRLTESDRAMLRQLAASWYPGEQRKQSQTVRRLIREAYARLLATAHENAPADA